MRVPLLSRLTFSGQFLAFGMIVLLAGMITIGLWAQREIRQVTSRRTAEVTALYVDSFVAESVQALATGSRIDARAIATLDEYLKDTALGDQFVNIKLWARDGTIAYSTSEDLIGRVFDLHEELERALTGELVSGFTDLLNSENEYERTRAESLIETYAPISRFGTGETIAAMEFYQHPGPLLAAVRSAQMRGWSVVVVATALMYVMLLGLVRRSNNLIELQRAQLEGNVTRLSDLLADNRRLQRRMRDAAGRVTALNEQFLHRVSADLHDGPAQCIAVALLRLDTPDSAETSAQRPSEAVRTALDSALGDIRSIARGLRLPEIDALSTADAAAKCILEFERISGTRVDVEFVDVPTQAPLATKITMYRILQEALANSYKHAEASTRTVTLGMESGSLRVEIGDDGPPFNTDGPWREGALGLAGMKERTEMLGGEFELLSSPDGGGTRVRVILPLKGDPDD